MQPNAGAYPPAEEFARATLVGRLAYNEQPVVSFLDHSKKSDRTKGPRWHDAGTVACNHPRQFTMPAATPFFEIRRPQSRLLDDTSNWLNPKIAASRIGWQRERNSRKIVTPRKSRDALQRWSREPGR